VRVKPVVTYSIARLGLFAVLVVILVPLLSPWLAAYWATLIAAVIAFCVSYLAFGKLRRRVTEELAASRASKETSTLRTPARASDEEAEDGTQDALEGDRGSQPKPE
jgi:O-antigen/teichoic acid export membrane protein